MHMSAPRPGVDSITYREEFGAALRVWRDNHMSRDMAWVRKIHPGSLTLEKWMRTTGYDGSLKPTLKQAEDRAMSLKPNKAKIRAL